MYSAKDIDRKKELRKLNHSILVNFLDLIDILIKCPESPKRDEKIEDTNLLFIHMHHLINEFRPHQVCVQEAFVLNFSLYHLYSGKRDTSSDVDGSKKKENTVHREVQRAFREGGIYHSRSH